MKVAIVILNEVKDPFPTRHGFFACGLSMTLHPYDEGSNAGR
jgi:hypothetical protein